MTWTCPECGRSFARAGQWHSCVLRSVNEHFAERAHRSFARPSTGWPPPFPQDVEIEPVKTTIHLTSGSRFGAVDLRRHYLRIGFLFDRALESGAS